MDDLERLQEMHREILVLLADINDIEKNISRLHNELLEMNKKAQDKMNDED